MNFDLILLGLVILFGIFGAFTGVARQLGHLVGLISAYFAAPHATPWVAPYVAQYLRLTPSISQIVTRFLVFFVVFLVVRFILTFIIKQILKGKEGEESTDKLLGFALGAFKSAALIYVCLCALSYAEDNILVKGKSLGLAPQESKFFNAARRYNLFDLGNFSQVKELSRVLKAFMNPEQVERLKEDSGFEELEEDPRLRKLLSDATLRDAVEKSDYVKLLENQEVLKLLKDTDFTRKLNDIAQSVDKRYSDLN